MNHNENTQTYPCFSQLVGKVVILICLLTISFSISANSLVEVEIPPQSMQQALGIFSDKTNINLLYAPEIVNNIKTNGITGQGKLPWNEALKILLKGSGLSFKQSGENSAAIFRTGLSAGKKTEVDVPQSSDEITPRKSKNKPSLPDSSTSGNTESETTTAVDTGFSIEEIVVTAMKRSEKLFDVPISMTAFTNQSLQDAGINDLEDFVLRVPGLEYTTQQPGRTFINIRGVSSLSGAATVGVYFDESPVTFNFFQADFKTIDMERIEILRGPQGTLFGEGAMGGTVRFITNKPNADKVEGDFAATYSDTSHGGDNKHISGVLNLPIVEDTLALRGVFYYQDEDGFVNNAVTGETDVNSLETTGGRISARLFASDNLTFTSNIIYQKNEVGANNNANADLVNISNGPEPSDDEYYQVNLTVDYQLPWVELVSSTSYFDRDFGQTLDLSAFLAFVQNFFDPTVTAINSTFDVRQEVWSQELRAVSRLDSRFQWLVGFFYKDNESGTSQPLTIDNALGNGVDANSVSDTTKIRQYAFFGELYYDITENLRATVGLRYFDEKFESMRTESGLFITGNPLAPPIQFMEESSSSELLPKFILDYKINEDTLVYFSAGKGFRSGGNNRGIFVPAANDSFEPDSVWSYELGTKFAAFDKRLAVTAAFFYIDWNDVQIRQAILDPGGSGAILGQFTANSGKAHSTGFETEIVVRPFEGLELAAGGNIMEAETDETSLGGGGLVPEGTRLPRVPKWSFNLSGQYRFPIYRSGYFGFLRADYQRVGNRLSNETGTNILPEYGIANLRAGIEKDNWEIAIFASNVGDTLTILDTAPPTSEFRNTPRTVGLTIRARM